jgi:acyl-ACP thioesterase
MAISEVEPGVWNERTRIHSYDVDLKQEATLEWLCRLFLEAAWNHAEQLGVGFRHLAAQQKLWVLSRMLVEVEQSPAWGEEVTLSTWPRSGSSIFAMRDFEIANLGGRRLVAGVSAWLLLDAQSKRPQRLHSLTPLISAFSKKRALQADPQKLPVVNTCEPALATKALYSAVDVNSHVNSAKYISWILDSYPLEFHRRHRVRRLEINYLGETPGGAEISARIGEGSFGEFWHSIVTSNGDEVCRAKMLWTDAET